MGSNLKRPRINWLAGRRAMGKSQNSDFSARKMPRPFTPVGENTARQSGEEFARNSRYFAKRFAGGP